MTRIRNRAKKAVDNIRRLNPIKNHYGIRAFLVQLLAKSSIHFCILVTKQVKVNAFDYEFHIKSPSKAVPVEKTQLNTHSIS